MHHRAIADGWQRVVGAFGYWREQGRFVVLKAKSIVVASGGIGKAWPITSNSWECTGDGITLAYEAGADLLDMEFVQFHPTGMVWPPGVQGLLVTEAVRGEGGILRNKLGERFMEKYDPKRMELSTRDLVARSIYTEVKEGRGSEHGGAFLDISHKPPEYVKQSYPACTISSKSWRMWTSPKGHGSRAPMPLHDGRHSGGRRNQATTLPGCLPPVKLLPDCTEQTAWAATHFLIWWYWPPGRAVCGAHASKISQGVLDTNQIAEAERDMLAPFDQSAGENPTLSIVTCKR